MRSKPFVLGFAVVLLAVWGPVIQSAQANITPCDLANAETSSDGIRRLALLFGVGKYANEKIPDLDGPKKDVEAMYALLTDSVNDGGYAFPKKNVCTFVDEDVTRDGVVSAFKSTLGANLSAEDLVVVFYAGHGAQLPDQNGDEAGNDTWDEVFVLHDSMVLQQDGQRRPPLYDDEFNELLHGVHKVTENITVIIDACTSDSLSRGGRPRIADFRSLFPDEFAEGSNLVPGPILEGNGDGGPNNWAPTDLEDIVLLTAAADDTLAYEGADGGDFTQAFISAARKVSRQSVTYASLQAEVLEKTRAKQTPRFQGRTSRVLFDVADRQRPLYWSVRDVKTSTLILDGPVLPGAGEGAEFRLYDKDADFQKLFQPEHAKAIARVTLSDGIFAEASVEAPNGADKIQLGDIAILQKTADAFQPVTVHLDQSLSASVRTAIKDSVSAMEYARLLIDLDGADDAIFLVEPASNDVVHIKDTDGYTRNQIDFGAGTKSSARQTAIRLLQHAFTFSLVNISGNNNMDFRDQATLKVQFDPTGATSSAPCKTEALPSDPSITNVNGVDEIDLCSPVGLTVTVRQETTQPVSVGGVFLNSNGDCLGFPAAGPEVMDAGRSKLFGRTYLLPAVGPENYVIMFASPVKESRRWDSMCDFVNVAQRGAFAFDRDTREVNWSKTVYKYRVVKNDGVDLAQTEVCTEDNLSACRLVE